MSGSGGAAAAAAAAARAERIKREEEEEMTRYTKNELAEDWEFKILRSNNAFKTESVLRRVCAEESESGWVLVEKFDNSRLRFKRLRHADHGESDAGIDPYRTHYGMSPLAYALLMAFFILAPLIIIFLLITLAIRP